METIIHNKASSSHKGVVKLACRRGKQCKFQLIQLELSGLYDVVFFLFFSNLIYQSAFIWVSLVLLPTSQNPLNLETSAECLVEEEPGLEF